MGAHAMKIQFNQFISTRPELLEADWCRTGDLFGGSCWNYCHTMGVPTADWSYRKVEPSHNRTE